MDVLYHVSHVFRVHVHRYIYIQFAFNIQIMSSCNPALNLFLSLSLVVLPGNSSGESLFVREAQHICGVYMYIRIRRGDSETLKNIILLFSRTIKTAMISTHKKMKILSGFFSSSIFSYNATERKSEDNGKCVSSHYYFIYKTSRSSSVQFRIP